MTLRLTKLLALGMILLLSTVGCTKTRPPQQLSGQGTASGSLTPTVTINPADLGRVEIRNYKSKPLTAIADEPENSIKGPQHINIATYRLNIHDEVNKPIKLTYKQILAMPSVKKVVTLHCVEGWSVTYLWQGVLLEDLLEKAGGAKPDAKVMIFECADGYETALPLDYIKKNHIMLGYKMNGLTTPPERGFPFQVIAEDRFGYKWAKWVTGIDVNYNKNYQGYWEFRGYDNTATLPPGLK